MKTNHGRAFALLLAGGILVSSGQAEDTATIKQSRVNVRGQASLTGEVITQLSKGETVRIIEEITVKKNKAGQPVKWYRIAMPANTPLWVNGEFIDPTNKTVLPKTLNVRTGPGENFSVVARLNKGTPVKDIRSANNWLEIEPPPNAFAFVAAEFVDWKSAAPTNPPPVTEVAAAKAPVPVETIAAPTPVAPAPAPKEPAPALAEPVVTKEPAAPVAAPAAVEKTEAPATPPAPVAPKELPKRIVKREGIVRRALNLQAPTFFELENKESGHVINYLHAENHPEYKLKMYIGFKVIVTGEESIDARWPKTPVIEIETLELP
jgi:SH3-like domain-containing protein